MTEHVGVEPEPTSRPRGGDALMEDDQSSDGRFDDPYGPDPYGRSDGVDETRPVTAAKKKMNPLVEWLIVIAVAITSALLVRAFIVQQFAVEGESMLNTLQDGDRVLVNRLSYRLHDPRRGDVVVLKRFDANATERDLIKRVIGLPGEKVEFRSCVVYINDQPLSEPYIDPIVQERDGCGGDQNAVTVPDGAVYVLGDHRGKSSDSRVFGSVPENVLIGRAFVIIWPVGDWAWL
jgi:signal peptidase I